MLKTILTEAMYVICGLVCFYTAYQALTDKNNKAKITSAIFWVILGVIFAFSEIGKLWGNTTLKINPAIIGYLIVIMCILSALKLVKFGKIEESSNEFKQKMSSKIGSKIFIPAVSLALVTFIVAQIFKESLGSLVALGIGTVISGILALIITRGKPKEMLNDGSRLLQIVGPVNILPQLLAALGALFTAAGVGDVIANGISSVVPMNNPLIGVVVYCLGMALFTMIMGNGFAAFTVITTGIGVPFVIAQGGNPVVVAALGLTAGFCGTLLTPMAANFNIVPAAILEIKDTKYGVIKYQAPVAIVMLILHIVLMYFWAF